MLITFTPATAAAIGGLVFTLTTGAGTAHADPDLGPVFNTTCSYTQVVSAISAQNPVAAAELSASPTAQGALRGFLASSPEQRQQIYQELRNRPGADQYVDEYAGAVLQVADTCNNY